MPYLIEVFLPLERGDGSEVSWEQLEGLTAQLAERFGGATAYTHSPAEGLWKPEGKTIRDRIIIVEVMIDELDRVWWAGYRTHLQVEFKQEEVLIRATSVERL